MGCGATRRAEQGLVNKILFPAPTTSSYADWDFKGELLWVPLANYAGVLGGPDKNASDNYAFPCRLMQYPSAKYMLILLHKNADDLGSCKSFCDKLRGLLSVHVLVVEYPGYGLCSASTPSADQVNKHVFAALAFAQKTLSWPLKDILLFGVCLGAGPAIAVAAEVEIGGVVLIAPFLSVRQMFRDHAGLLAGLVTEQFPNDKLVTCIKSPTLIFHGQRDEMVPAAHSEQLHRGLNSRSRLVSPPEANHHTNLLGEESYLIGPMKDFFGLAGNSSSAPDVPPWALQRRLCLLAAPPDV